MNLLKTYYSAPNTIKNVLVSAGALYKRRQKYGKYFNEYYNYLINSDINDQKLRADDRLEEFLFYQRKSSPYFRDKIAPDLDLNKTPKINKNIVLKNYHKIINKGAVYKTAATSGSTGQPIKIPYSKEVYQKEYAFWWYHRYIKNIVPGSRIATIAGHKVIAVDKDAPPFWVHNYAENQLFLSSYHLSNRNIGCYIKELNRFKPLLLHGYSSSIYLLAKYIIENNVETSFTPRMIIPSSETTHAFHRKAIEEAFNCKVYNLYGNVELCGHITECVNGRLHLQPYHSHVRILKDDGQSALPGETGRIVATNFTNYAFPLINYDTGDVVKVSKHQSCDCKKGGLIIDEIHGRWEDHIITPEGRIVTRLAHIFKNAGNIRNAQIEQSKIDKVLLIIEKGDHYSVSNEKQIKNEAKSRLGNKMAIEFRYVNEIKKDKNGKFKFIIQNMKSSDRQ